MCLQICYFLIASFTPPMPHLYITYALAKVEGTWSIGHEYVGIWSYLTSTQCSH